jgi:carbonic anhydrase
MKSFIKLFILVVIMTYSCISITNENNVNSKKSNLQVSFQVNTKNNLRSSSKSANANRLLNYFHSKKSSYNKQIDMMIDFHNKSRLAKNDFSSNLQNFNIKSESKLNLINEKNVIINKVKESTSDSFFTNFITKKESNHFHNPTNNDDILEDWFMIASLEFDNISKYPPIILSNGKEIRISHDNKFFRINDGYNCKDTDEKPPKERLFWFRLNRKNSQLFYSSSKTDFNVLGAISISSAKEVSKIIDDSFEKEIYCFNIVDKEGSEWKICNCNKILTVKWYCALKEILKDNSDPLCKLCNKKNEIVNEVVKTVIQPIIIFPTTSQLCNEVWNYKNNGKDWNCVCKEGLEQSPIDLPVISSSIDSPIKPIFNYSILSKNYKENTSKKLKYLNFENTKGGMHTSNHEDVELEVVNNKLRIAGFDLGKLVTLDGTVYRAEEIIFHSPSQHTIGGIRYDLELTILHSGISKGDISKQASVSFLFKSTPGSYNMFFESIDYLNLPNAKLNSRKKEILKDIYIPNVFFSKDDEDYNIDMAGKKCFSFFTYQGSLMFPPCTERTIIFVASEPIPLSSTIISLIKESLSQNNSNGTENNFREIQNRNGRPVFHFDCEKSGCGQEKRQKKKEKIGHYEKVIKTVTDYFYVQGDKPSGLPGSYVVPEKEFNNLLN